MYYGILYPTTPLLAFIYRTTYPLVEQARIGCFGLCLLRNLAILPFSVKQIIISTSESFSKAIAHEVEHKTSIEEALIPSAFTVYLIFM
jgi:hypothetical protein